VAVGIEAVDRGHLVEEVVHQALDPARVLERGEQRREVVGQRLRVRGELTDVGDDRLALGQRGAADVRGSAQGLERRDPCRREGPELLDEAVDGGRLLAEVGEDRRRLAGERAQALHGGRQLTQEGRQLGDVLLEVARALGRGLAREVGLRDEVGDPRPVAGQRGEDHVAVAGQVGQRAVLVGEDPQDLVGLLERRVGVPDAPGAGRRRAPASPVPSSLRMIVSRSR
jgi:hypothetical protein